MAIKQKGFTLIEILIALASLTAISLFIVQALGPWLTFKQKLDTEDRLNLIGKTFEAIYTDNAFNIDDASSDVFPNVLRLNDGRFFYTHSISPSPDGGFVCNILDPNMADSNWRVLGAYLKSDSLAASKDGYGSEFCVLTSKRHCKNADGYHLFYRALTIVSVGPNGVLDKNYLQEDSASQSDECLYSANAPIISMPGSNLTKVDDKVYYINGFDIQRKKFIDSNAKLQKISNLFQTYFNMRYLSAASRDTTKDYFGCTSSSSNWDHVSSNCGGLSSRYVPVSGSGAFDDVADVKQVLGLDTISVVSAWDALADATLPYKSNSIFYNNRDLCLNTGVYDEDSGLLSAVKAICAKSPYSSPSVGNLPPYSTLIFTRLPGLINSGSADPQYLIKVAAGIY